MIRSKSFPWFGFSLLTVAAAGAVVAALGVRPGGATGRGPGSGTVRVRPVAFEARPSADPFAGGVAWINTAGPIRLSELRGKVVLLDFWTYCCINCHHVLPDLAKLEEKYRNELVVIGVHTPKFYAEQDTENIRQKVREYRIKHPVISDANMTIWNEFDVHSWPTLVLIDVDGTPFGKVSGEGHYAVLDQAIGELVQRARAKGALNETPVKFFPENEKPDNTPLLYPGKVLADAKTNHLFISDTGHNRIVQTDLAGKNAVVIGNGGTGLTDGPFDRAEFNRPQGMVLVGETLYVADTENHALRAVDLSTKTVSTVAGTGKQWQGDPRQVVEGPGKTTALSSPWDLAYLPNTRSIFIAMAGPHQIWRFDLETWKVGRYAGTGMENCVDGDLNTACFAQPSGLATDGLHLFVADSEASAVREIILPRHRVSTLAGTHDLPNGQSLFAFGDHDGKGPSARFQHCLGVAYGDGKLFIADTYNNKIKAYDPKTHSVKTIAGTGKPGAADAPAQYYQPGGLSVAGSKLYVADTNNQQVRVIDLANDAVSTLPIDGLTSPAAPARRPAFPNAVAETLKPSKVAPGAKVALDVTLPIPAGYKLNTDSPMPFVVESNQDKLIAYSKDFPETGKRLDTPAKHFTIEVPLSSEAKAGAEAQLKLSVLTGVCNEGSNFCTIKSYVWTLPVTFAVDGASSVKVPGEK
jgi:thiol-disulfide isomerase/thioredoxin